MQRLVDERGRTLQLGEKLGEGGEGAVFRLATSQLAVKVYNEPLTSDRAAKIRMLAALAGPEVQQFTAWPVGLVLDEVGRPRGLILPAIEQAKDIHHLYSPGSRRTSFPDADWRFLVHAATNVARAFAAVHQLGLVIGDVNHGSVLVANNGTVRLIDVDSFQVPRTGGPPLLCTVAVPLFQPPELVGADLSTTIRSANHDAFGLAVLLFQLLLQGRHPFAGRYLGPGDMPIERAIPEHRFAFAANAAARQMQPPPNAVGLDILPSSLGWLFEAAFAPDAAQRGRPPARQWVEALNSLTRETVNCRRAATHYYAGSLSLCPWCDFETRTGVFLFGVRSSAGASAAIDPMYNQLLALVRSVRTPMIANPDVRPSTPAPSPAAQQAAGKAKSPRVYFVFGVLAVITGLMMLPVGWSVVALGSLLMLGRDAVTRHRRRPWIKTYRRARRDFESATERLRRANAFPNYNRVRSGLAPVLREWDSIPTQRRHMFEELERNKRTEQMRQFLGAQLIERAGIPGIGPSRLAMLASYGIDTAADVTYDRVLQVPQFGATLASRLAGWRRAVEGRFVFDASQPLPRHAVTRIEREIEDRKRRCIERLRQLERALRAASAADTGAALRAVQELNASTRFLEQAEADVRAVLGKVPV